MKMTVEIELSYDDLSEECKGKIRQLENSGNIVKLIWPSNNGISWTSIGPSYTPAPQPINIDNDDSYYGDLTKVYCTNGNVTTDGKNVTVVK